MAKQGQQTLSVRVALKHFNALSKYAENNKYRGFSQAKVVESLIRYFIQQSKEQQDLIMLGLNTDYFELIGEAMQLIHWGDHSFINGILPWAISTYNKLDKISVEAQTSIQESLVKEETVKDMIGVLSLRRIAWFKLGSSWMDLAAEIRRRALVGFANSLKTEINQPVSETPDNSKPSLWKERYNSAIESLKVAIIYHRYFNESLGNEPHPTVLYNEACAWSLIAQYINEKNATNEVIIPLAEIESKKEEEKLNQIKEQFAEVALYATDNFEISKALQKVSECLNKINIEKVGETKGIPLVDTQWLFDYADNDLDLAFFRNNKDDLFKNWLDARKSPSSLLTSFKRLRSDLPSDVLDKLESDTI